SMDYEPHYQEIIRTGYAPRAGNELYPRPKKSNIIDYERVAMAIYSHGFGP
ncbi:hypothetical protein LTR49_026303, partial [Elasticomyces elasticus]